MGSGTRDYPLLTDFSNKVYARQDKSKRKNNEDIKELEEERTTKKKKIID